MKIESSEEIEKMFYQDSYHKKKVGSNVFRRTGKGSPTAKVTGGVRFAKNNFKKYEKNSKVKKYNLFQTVVPYEKFKTLSETDQKEVLSEWLLRYPKVKIFKKMGIGEKRLNLLIRELNINKKNGEMMKLSREDMEKYKKDIIPHHIFKLLPAYLKFELVDHYQKHKGMTNREIAKALDYALNTFTSQKSLWRKEFEGRDNMSHQDNFLLQGAEDIEESKSKESKVNVTNEEKATKHNNEVVDSDKIEDEDLGNTFYIEFNGDYKGADIKQRIKSFEALLHDQERYRVSITIESAEE